MRFAFSTHPLFAEPLAERHVAELARMTFGSIELFAAPGHVDLANGDAMRALGRWLTEARVRLTAIHTPIVERDERGGWSPTGTLASTDDARRQRAIQQARTALELSDIVPFEHLVVHLGLPSDVTRGADSSRASACRSLEVVAELAESRGVRVAIEVLPNRLSTVEALVDLIEDELDLPQVGICFDTGHAHLLGDVVEGLELASGHLLSVHLGDNRGRRDDHLLPFEGTIDWAATVMTLQKIGFDGPLVLTPAPGRPFGELLDRARAAAQRLEDLCA